MSEATDASRIRALIRRCPWDSLVDILNEPAPGKFSELIDRLIREELRKRQLERKVR